MIGLILRMVNSMPKITVTVPYKCYEDDLTTVCQFFSIIGTCFLYGERLEKGNGRMVYLRCPACIAAEVKS